MMKNGDAGIFPVYYSLKKNIYAKCRILRYYFTAKLVHRKIQKTISCIWLIFKNNKISLSTLCFWYVCGTYCSRSSLLRKSAHKKTMLSTYQLTSVEQQNTKTGDNAFQIIKNTQTRRSYQYSARIFTRIHQMGAPAENPQPRKGYQKKTYRNQA